MSYFDDRMYFLASKERCDNMFYRVVRWETDEIITEVTSLKSAKKRCREMGHTDEHNGKWYLPIARVDNNAGECVYNPRFKVK